ncbi:flavoprotein [Asanoa sp. NPDC049518]|uniref:flavoprotein n=1 Tax=unclassified Asanoa TaxID=2685164 RepID=UPI003428C30C
MEDHRAEHSLLLCVTGSVAAAGAISVLQVLVERGRFAKIYVALSDNALRFVREEPFAILSRQRCITNIFDDARDGRAVHVELAYTCQVAVVMPATGNVIAKLAHGFADDTVTSMLSVFEGHRILVPAVHPATSRQPSFQRNLKQATSDGFMLCGPVAGYSMSENRRGRDVAAMPDPAFVAAFVEYVLMTGEPPDIRFSYPSHGMVRESDRRQ